MRVTLSSNTEKKAKASKKKPQLHLSLVTRDIHHQDEISQAHQLRSVLSLNLLQTEHQIEVLRRHLLIELQPGVLLHLMEVLVVVHHRHRMVEASDRQTTREGGMMIATIIVVATDVMNEPEDHPHDTMRELVTASLRMVNAAIAEIIVIEMLSEIVMVDCLDAVMIVVVAQVAETIHLPGLMITEDRVLDDLRVAGIRLKIDLIDLHLYVQNIGI